jgi:NAD(P)-dependent dehydrogenase (short-subunit alcohol dehydrogenase family)
VHYDAADITTAEGCTLVAYSVLDHLGGIDIVVNVLGGSEAPAAMTTRRTPEVCCDVSANRDQTAFVRKHALGPRTQ